MDNSAARSSHSVKHLFLEWHPDSEVADITGPGDLVPGNWQKVSHDPYRLDHVVFPPLAHPRLVASKKSRYSRAVSSQDPRLHKMLKFCWRILCERKNSPDPPVGLQGQEVRIAFGHDLEKSWASFIRQRGTIAHERFLQGQTETFVKGRQRRADRVAIKS